MGQRYAEKNLQSFSEDSSRKSHSYRYGHSERPALDRKSTRLNSSHSQISYAVFCLKKKKTIKTAHPILHYLPFQLRSYLPIVHVRDQPPSSPLLIVPCATTTPRYTTIF